MLDADNLPLKDPTYLFQAPHIAQHGVMAWLDLWSPELSSSTFVGWDSVYPLVGLNKQPYLVRPSPSGPSRHTL
jgi:alpha 1,2-mannosyltransferase